MSSGSCIVFVNSKDLSRQSARLPSYLPLKNTRKMMTSDELLIKFKEDGVNAKAETPESTVGGENLLSLKKSTCK